MSDMPVTARVAVAGATYWTDQLYDYLIPTAFQATVHPGMRVTVPFGRGNRHTEGIVFSLGYSAPEMRCKPISALLDTEPVLDTEMLSLTVWMRRRYFCTVYDAVHAMLPAGLWYQMEKTYVLCDGTDREKAYSVAENRGESTVLDAVFAHDGCCPYSDLETVFEGSDPSRALQSLVRKGVLEAGSRDKRRIGDKTRKIASLAVSAEDAADEATRRSRRAPMQSEVLRFLCTQPFLPAHELCVFTGASMPTLHALEKAGLIELSDEEVFRRPFRSREDVQELPVLNEEQASVLAGLLSGQNSENRINLLYGVTGSGKTSVYLHLIDKTLRAGKSAILMVPEIALTPQMIRIFCRHFGDTVAVLHSSLSVGERYDEWKRIRSGLAKLVIGTRSAVFAPVSDLGLIIMDEEQEYTYKSENSPRYHAREIAQYRASSRKAMLVLGSATPSLESRYYAAQGRYNLFRLRNRYNEQKLPGVSIIDMKEELRTGIGGELSRALLTELQSNIDKGEQSILFLNRRGTASMVVCGECGYSYSCPNCSVKLTWHGDSRKLVCHHCGYTRRLDEKCPECGGLLTNFGAGTQKLEEELKNCFPDTEILRMDADSVGSSGSHDKILSRFREKKVPILVGTQMVSKGLDFENVTLVGVISADQLLYSGDFRSSERTFSLITQVVGRSGRGEKPGRALIQTYTPDNQVIALAAKQDYDSFYEAEIALRQCQYGPPFAEIITLTASGIDESAVLRCCTYIRDLARGELKGREDIRILGPAPLPVVRVNRRYRYRVSIHGKNDKQLREIVSALLNQCNTAKEFRGVSVYADLNPME